MDQITKQTTMNAEDITSRDTFDMENVTQRRYIPQRTSSMSDITKDTIFDSSMTSLPSISLNESWTRADLWEKINALTEELKNTVCELKIAHQEIENLNGENYRLKMDLQKTHKIIENYKKINIVDNITRTPVSRRKMKKNKRHSLDTSTSLHPNPLADWGRPSEHVKLLPNPLADANKSLTTLSLSSGNSLSVIPESSNISPLPNNNTSVNSVTGTKRKLCILSNRHFTGSLNTIEDTFSSEFNFCRYLLPNFRIKELFTNLKNKLCNFTMDDYCIILLGEADFKLDCNFIELINTLTDAIKDINMTNVIICTPTYVLGAPVYNYKIELFNTLLQVELQKNQFVHFFDSNESLNYEMFSDLSGRINKFGLIHIFKTIMMNMKIDFQRFPIIITYDSDCNRAIEKSSESNYIPSNQLFRV